MEKEFDNLIKTIKEHCNKRKIFYFANPGNWGDALIRVGTLQFLKDNNLDFEELTDLCDFERIRQSKNSCLLYGGGGGWCKLWNHSPQIVFYMSRFFKKIIVLPSTYEMDQNVSNCIYFRRDEYESKILMPNSIFCHDLALYLKHKGLHKGIGTGFFFRTDSESAGRIKIPSVNVDLSLKNNHFGDVTEFFSIIEQHRVIYTDRLHIAIAGCLLNRKVHLYPGSYWKNRSVYLSSLAGQFENIKFIDIDRACT